MKFLIFLVFINSLSAFEEFDFVEIALKKYVNHSADPCENFYRHACPIGSPLYLVTEEFKILNNFIEEAQKFAVWNNVLIQQDAKRFYGWESQVFSNWEGKPSNFFFEIASLTCDVSDDLFFAFLDKLQKIQDIPIVSALKMKKDDEQVQKCSQVLPVLDFALDSMISQSISKNMYVMSLNVSRLIYKIRSIDGHLMVDVRGGIASAKIMVDAMKELAKEAIKDTPWALRNNVTEKIENVAAQLNLHDNFAKDLEVAMNNLFEIEKSYLACQLEFSQVENSDLFCYIYVAFTSPIVDTKYRFFLDDNGINDHPKIFFGFPNYYHNQYGKELAAKLGFTGFTAGHEIGHTLVDDHNQLENLPFFSQNAQDCIQNQYNKTCEYYEEEPCTIRNASFDDNGADIVGLQLAYALLENLYGDKISETIERLKVTNDQLFFYAFAFQFCSGVPLGNRPYDLTHSVSNVRVNAAAQHPGFQKAFNCDSNSRMMESATEQCHIYGLNAPQTRKSANPKILRL